MDDDKQPPVTDPPSPEGGETDGADEEERTGRRRWVVGAGLVVVLALVAAGVILGSGNKIVGPAPVSPLPASATASVTASAGPLSPGVRLEVRVPPGTTGTVINEVATVLSRRLAGVARASVTPQASGAVVVLPPSSVAQQLLNVVQDPGTFEVRPVLGISQTVNAAPEGPDDPSQPVHLGARGPGGGATYSLGPAVLTGTAVDSAEASSNGDTWAVQITFTTAATPVWTHFTGQLACASGTGRQFALVLDGQVAAAPGVSSDVKCNAGITAGATILDGGFTQAEAQQVATVLTSGALPVPISVVAGAP